MIDNTKLWKFAVFIIDLSADSFINLSKPMNNQYWVTKNRIGANPYTGETGARNCLDFRLKSYY